MWLQRKSGKQSVEQLGALESEIMECVWKRGSATVRDACADLCDRLAYTTVMTTLDRLYKKGLLTRCPEGRAFRYTPQVAKPEYNEQLTQHLLGIAVAESGSKQAVMSSFIDYVSESDLKSLDELDRLIRAKKKSLRGSK